MQYLLLRNILLIDFIFFVFLLMFTESTPALLCVLKTEDVLDLL